VLSDNDIHRDITNIRPMIIKWGRDEIDRLRFSSSISRTKKRKWGLIHNPWKRNAEGKRRA